ncbi:hypothetical protein MP638_004424 [Amoeboaphelidium occidentale]|nr:hypothetical protein MP638_004424 [Amoeboaphelidium occidentale]
MGHITLIVDKLLLFLERERSSDLVKTDLKGVFEDEEWQEFIKKSYRETKDKESRVLGGVRAGLFGTPSLQHNQDETERSAQPVDVNTDQLARYMVSQIMSGFPPAFSVSFDGSGNDPFGSAWTELDDIKEYDGGFHADNNDPFTVPASNSTPNPVRESDESDESDEDGNSLNWNTPGKNDDPFSSNSSSSLRDDPFAVRNEDSGISSNEGSSTWTADFSKMKISDNEYERQGSE